MLDKLLGLVRPARPPGDRQPTAPGSHAFPLGLTAGPTFSHCHPSCHPAPTGMGSQVGVALALVSLGA